MERNGVAAFAAFVTLYRDVRAEVRRIAEEAPSVEVYVEVSLEEAMRRDPRSIYKKALAGEIKNFTGVDDPYEEPERLELVLVNEGGAPEEGAERLLKFLAARELLQKLMTDVSRDRR